MVLILLEDKDKDIISIRSECCSTVIDSQQLDIDEHYVPELDTANTYTVVLVDYPALTSHPGIRYVFF
jgi:hypothetical protein